MRELWGVMRSRLKLPLCLLALLVLAVPATAQAKYSVGIGEQNAGVFDNAAWQSGKLKRIRYMVPWDWQKHPYQIQQDAYWMGRAQAAKQDVLVAFTAPRGCYVNGKYKKNKTSCKAPSVSAYRKAFRAFDARYPWVKTYSAWNEINHHSQPTYSSPKRAAQYYNTLRGDCRKRKCQVMAADLLDTSNMLSYLSRMKRYIKGSPKLWGLHNYQDVNRFTSHDTLALLRAVRGQVWLTETGGIAGFGRQFKYSLTRQVRATKWMFKLADRYNGGRHGAKAKLTRLFVYSWFGQARTKTTKKTNPFDAGLVYASGKARPAYKSFLSKAKRHR
jgi:hypothetical protein